MTKHAVKSGIILPWFASPAQIPPGYILCDGTGGSPNLQTKVTKKDNSPRPQLNPVCHIMKT